MIVIMQQGASDELIDHVVERIELLDLAVPAVFAVACLKTGEVEVL